MAPVKCAGCKKKFSSEKKRCPHCGMKKPSNEAVDLFDSAKGKSSKSDAYTARDIEVLEGLEPVRRRPGMYIGGTDENAMHHLASEVFDNAMDEAVAGFASRIEVELADDNRV